MSDPLVDDEHFRRKDTGVWQRKLLPFMMASLVVVGIVFFAGTFYIYNTLTQRLQHVDSPIAEAVDRAQALAPNAQFLDWYVRATLEERAIAGRQRQYNAVVEGRLWTRLMGFLAGMVMVLAGSVFILGKLESEFDGTAKTPQGEGSVKTNSPGLVLVVAGTILLSISLLATIDVKSEDGTVYLPQLMQPAEQPQGAVTSSKEREVACKNSSDPTACLNRK